MIDEIQMGVIFAAVQHSPDASDLAKKVAHLMIKKTCGFDKSARILITADKDITEAMVKEIYYGLHDMLSSNQHTLLTQIFKTVAGVSYRFAFSYSGTSLRSTLAYVEFKSFGEPEILTYEQIMEVDYTVDAKHAATLKEFLGPEHKLFPYL